MENEAKIREFFYNDRFCRTNGVVIESVSDSRAVARLQVEERHLNASGGVQGGVLFTMADFAFALLANAGGLLTVSTSASISFLRGAKGRVLRAVATPLHLGKRTATCLVQIYDEAGDTPVACATFDGIRMGVNEGIKG